MKSLLLLRHAKSSWKNLGIPDHDRPLNDRGREDAPRMGELLLNLQLLPDAILCSSAKRARRTAEKVAHAAQYVGEIRIVPALYMAPPETYIDSLTLANDAFRLLMVGHNPGIESLLYMLSGTSERMTTASLAHIQLPVSNWSDVTVHTKGELAGFWRPNELPDSE